MIERINQLRQRMSELKLDGILITNQLSRLYLSGFMSSAGYLIVSTHDVILAVDFRYLEQAKLQTKDFTIKQVGSDITRWLPDVIKSSGINRLGFEASDISFNTYKEIVECLKSEQMQMKFIPTADIVESQRALKDADELTLLTKAAGVVDEAYNLVREIARPGMTETQLAWECEKYIREHGSEPLPFEIIVASGPNSALPHYRAGNRVINQGEPIIIDICSKLNGYCSDLSRTICLGAPDKRFSQIYELVLAAQLTAIATTKSGMKGQEADRLARMIIEESGYADNFGHGLGHGVGLEVHESPRLNTLSQTTLTDNMVFTIEPGVYLPGWGGVRIEDTVVLEKGKARSLTNCKKTFREAVIKA